MSAVLTEARPDRIGAVLRVPVRAYVASDSESRRQFSEMLDLHRFAVLERGGWWDEKGGDEWAVRDFALAGPREVVEPVMRTCAAFIRRWSA